MFDLIKKKKNASKDAFEIILQKTNRFKGKSTNFIAEHLSNHFLEKYYFIVFE